MILFIEEFTSRRTSGSFLVILIQQRRAKVDGSRILRTQQRLCIFCNLKNALPIIGKDSIFKNQLRDLKRFFVPPFFQ
jgi:hypothetical protein